MAYEDKIQPQSIPVTGPMDTANPPTNRQPGTLLASVDVGTRTWGPRQSFKAMTWAGQATSISNQSSAAGTEFAFDGNNTYVKGTMPREQVDLGTRWTLDVWFSMTTATAGSSKAPIFQWWLDVVPTVAIEVGVYNASHATNPNKVYAIIKTTSAPTTVAHTYTLVGGTVVAGTSLTTAHKLERRGVRIVRDGATITLVDTLGSRDTSVVSAPLTERHEGVYANNGAWLLADTTTGTNSLFKGVVHKVCLRSGADSSVFADFAAIEHAYPRSRDVIFSATGSDTVGGGYVKDYSRFGSHGKIYNTGGASPFASIRRHPYVVKTQGIGTFTDNRGVTMSLIMAGGLLHYRKMS